MSLCGMRRAIAEINESYLTLTSIEMALAFVTSGGFTAASDRYESHVCHISRSKKKIGLGEKTSIKAIIKRHFVFPQRHTSLQE